MAFKKKAQKAVKKFKKALKKAPVYARKAKNTVDKVAMVAKKVNQIMTLMNVEKKRIDVTASAQVVSQLIINATGTYVADITPLPAQGVQVTQHTGSSIKIVSYCMKLSFWSQSTMNHPTKFIVEIFKVKGATQNVSTFLTDYYTTTPSSGVIDYNSNKDPDYFGQATKILSKTFSIQAPNFSGELMIKDLIIPRKYQHHIRFDQNSTTVDDGQLIMVIRADSGNSSGTVSTAPNVPVQTANSGYNFNMDCRYYYVDN